ncbi:MAG: alpha/beta hydrolase [Pseudomonadota bacterium]
MRFVLSVLGLLCCAGAAWAEPRITPVDCATLTAMPAGARAECGYLHVQENRANPASREIAIPYLRAKSTSAHPAPDPLIIMTGGPGDRAIHGEYIEGTSPLAHRDVIWFEQRGTALSQPALPCPEWDAAGRRGAIGEVNAAVLARALIAAGRTCAARARTQGADLSGYTSREIAADIEDLRRLLGFARVNLYGVSYGGRVVVEAARDYPGSVRSVFLNTPLPIEANYDEYANANMRRSLDMVFDGCATDPVCARAFPNIRTQFARIIANANTHPRQINVADGDAQVSVRVDGRVLASALLGQLYAPFTFEVLPRTIDAIDRGDEGALKGLIGIGGSGNAQLMRLAVWCNEEYPFENTQAIARQISDYPEFSGVDEANVPIGACEAAGFGDVHPPVAENAPASIDTPVFIVSGAFDPATPPAWASAMAAHMSHAQQAIFPAGGHGSGFYYPCAWTLLDAFLNDPSKPVDSACVFTLRSADFARSASPPDNEAR